MHTLKKLTLAIAAAGALTIAPLPALAENSNQASIAEARTEGSIATAFGLNQHLSSHRIEVKVKDGTATLTGNVENGVNKDLAEQVALGIDGVDKVDNRLVVDSDSDRSDAEQTSLTNSFNDATTTATVKSKLLWNRHTQGLDVNVNTDNGVVSLTGSANSEAARELAERLAANTHGVREVRNELQVSGEAGRAERAQEVANQAANEAVEVVSDAWITSKVKSSLLFERDLDGLDISVMSQNGQVTLGGRVDTDAGKALAIEIAQGIRGVNHVNAQALRVTQ